MTMKVDGRKLTFLALVFVASGFGCRDSDDSMDKAVGTCLAPLWVSDVGVEMRPGLWIVEGTNKDAPSNHDGSCSQEHGSEQVYGLVAPEDGWIEVALHGMGMDPLLHIRTTCDDPSGELACADDTEGLNSLLYFEAVAGQTYYLLADSFSEDTRGPYYMTVDTRPDGLIFPSGYWRSRGYGYGLLVDESTMSFVELTPDASTCIQVERGPHVAMEKYFDGFHQPSEDLLETHLAERTSTVVFDRSDMVPPECADGVTPLPGNPAYQRDPVLVFDVFSQIFEDHYAFFELRGVSWDLLTANARDEVNAETSDEELFDLMGEMILALNDRHSRLVCPLGQVFGAQFAYVLQLEQELEAAGGGDLEEYREQELDRYYSNIDGYLQQPAEEIGERGLMAVGRLGDEVGYLRITGFAMEGNAELDEALIRMSDVTTLVLDVRINTGGYDVAAMSVASRFAAERTAAFRKSARDGDGETEPRTLYIEPARIFDGRILLLVGPDTVSAGEIFVLAMRALPQVTLMGQPTMGILSDILLRTLPNGWSVGLSNEYYRTMEGDLFEHVGIPPHVSIEHPLFLHEDRAAGIDRGLDFVLDWIEANP